MDVVAGAGPSDSSRTASCTGKNAGAHSSIVGVARSPSDPDDSGLEAVPSTAPEPAEATAREASACALAALAEAGCSRSAHDEPAAAHEREDWLANEEDVDELLVRAVGLRDGKEMVRFALEQGACPSIVNELDGGRAVLSRAASEGRLEICRMLIDASAKLNVVEEPLGRTPLMWACIGGHERVVRLLLNARAEPTVTVPTACGGTSRYSALCYAITTSACAPDAALGVVRALLAAGASPDLPGGGCVDEHDCALEDAPPVYLAAYLGRRSVVSALLEASADVSSRPDLLIHAFERCESSPAALECAEVIIGCDIGSERSRLRSANPRQVDMSLKQYSALLWQVRHRGYHHPRLLTPSHAFSRLRTPSHAFSRLRTPSHASCTSTRACRSSSTSSSRTSLHGASRASTPSPACYTT